MNTGGDIDLAGLGVLVTRPAPQAHSLCRLIEAHGGRPILFPALVIEPVVPPTTALGLFAQNWDLVIYVSTNAVRFAATLHTSIPTGTLLAAIGTATAEALTVHLGRSPDLIPNQQDSEGLLALLPPVFTVDQRVLIVRGVGGRDLLADTLAQRGAQVTMAEVYRRSLPTVDSGALLARWDLDIQAVIATSGAILENIILLLGPTGRAKLLTTPLITISSRLCSNAEVLGFSSIKCATGASDNALLAALSELAR